MADHPVPLFSPSWTTGCYPATVTGLGIMTSQPGFNHHTGDELGHSKLRSIYYDIFTNALQTWSPDPDSARMPAQQSVFGPVSYSNPTQYHGIQQQQRQPHPVSAEAPRENEMAVEAMEGYREATGPFACNTCGKQYHRACDLNRHMKSHDRPFKCPEAECKYQTLGWPTEQELQRHHNDVHSSTPRTFACSFDHCGQTFKRESNCKQHMEKAHQWPYVRSRTVRTSYRCRVAGCNECSSLEETQRRHALSPLTPVTVQGARHFAADPILFPDEMVNHIFSGPGDPAYTYVTAEGQDPSESYVAWTSPPSRQQDISDALQKVQTTRAGPLFPLDPQLLQPASQPSVHQLSQYNSPIADQSAVPGLMHSPSPQLSSYPESRWPTTPSYQPSHDGVQSAAPGQHTAALGRSGQPTAQPSQASLASRRKRAVSERDDDNDDDHAKRPRRGKRRPMPAENFTDESMPCPFHLADPEVFCRSNKEKYSPCHTDHKDISTIVRHLARPAHKLVVKAKYISSFDAEDMEKAFVPAGLCRNCWKAFTDRGEFTRHFTQSCPRVSRGKREKFRLLFSTFCTELEGEEDDEEMEGSAEGNSPAADAGDEDEDAEGEDDEEEDLSQTVRMLTARLEKQEQNFQKLAGMTMRLYNACGQSGIIVNAQPKAPSQQQKARASSTPDRGGLVGGMDSHSTDVDRDAFMAEDVHRAVPVLQVTTSSGREIETDDSNLLSPTSLRHATQLKLPQRMAGVQSDSGYSGGSPRHVESKGKGPAVAVAIPATVPGSAPASAPASTSSMARSFAGLDIEQQGLAFAGRSMSLQVGGGAVDEQGVEDSQNSLSGVDFGAFVDYDDMRTFSQDPRQFGA